MGDIVSMIRESEGVKAIIDPACTPECPLSSECSDEFGWQCTGKSLVVVSHIIESDDIVVQCPVCNKMLWDKGFGAIHYALADHMVEGKHYQKTREFLIADHNKNLKSKYRGLDLLVPQMNKEQVHREIIEAVVRHQFIICPDAKDEDE
jgi:hypothetical protein